MRPDAASVPDDLSMLNDLSLWHAPSARRALIVWHLTIEGVWHLGKKARVAGAPGHLVVGGRGRRWHILFAHCVDEGVRGCTCAASKGWARPVQGPGRRHVTV